MTELMRIVRSRLPGPFWFTAQELLQAANLAKRSPTDPRKSPFGQAAIDKWLRHLVAARLLVVDAGRQAFYVVGFERTHRRAFQKAKERLEAHAEAGRLRYHIERDRAAPEDTTEAEFGFMDGGPVSQKRGGQNGRDIASEASLELSPNMYTQEALPNHGAESNFHPRQPPAPDPVEALGRKPDRRDLAFELLVTGYGRKGQFLRSSADLEGWEVDMAEAWRAQHGTEASAARVLSRRHAARRRTLAAECSRPRSPGQQAFEPVPICDAPLRAKPLLGLMAEADEHRQIVRRRGISKMTRAHQEARLVAIETLIGALRAPAAEYAEVCKFWQQRTWLGTLQGAPATCRTASMGLWAYVADRMEADGSSRQARNPAGVLVHRVGLWVAAQTTTERTPCQ